MTPPCADPAEAPGSLLAPESAVRTVAVRPQDAPRHAGQVVRRVLLRRSIVIDAETAQLVADAVQAALQADVPSRPRRPRVPAAEPLF